MSKSSPFVFPLLLLGLVCSGITITHAASKSDQTSPPDQATAVISGPDDIAIGRTIILDASASHVTGEHTEYRWSIDETKQIIGRRVEAIYTPERAGKLTFRLTVRSTDLHGRNEQVESVHPIIVFQRKIVVIADTSVTNSVLEKYVRTGLDAGVFVHVIRPEERTSVLGSEDAITALLLEQKQLLSNAESVVIWTQGIGGLQALMRYVHGDSEREATIQNETLILITERNLHMMARSIRGAYTLLHPQQIILTRKEALASLIVTASSAELQTQFQERGIDSFSLNATTLKMHPWDILSILVNYLLSHGVSGQTVILLLILPVIATIFSFLKQVIGITSFGLYTSSIVALSFLALGWWTGLLFLLFILSTGAATRSLMKHWRLLYIPKVAIILIVVSFSLLLLVGIGTWFGLTFSRDTVFILLMLSTQAETFLNLKTEEGWWSAILGVAETVFGASLCVFIVQWPLLQSVVLAYPELMLLTILCNVFLGRWTGLRFIEYVRFREVFRHLQEE